MEAIRVSAPAKLAVDISLARANLRVDGDYMDALITLWLQGITRKLEHDVGQVFMEQIWEVRLPSYPAAGESIVLPHPAMEVIAVKHSTADFDATLPSDAYHLSVGKYASFISPARDTTWPAAGVAFDVVITVKCGYGNTLDKVPETAQLFILTKLVEQFDPITRLERNTVQSDYLNGLVDDIRTYA